MSDKPWSLANLRTNFEWGGRAWQDPAEFDRAIAKIKAEALTEAADAMDADVTFRDPLRLKSDWLRIRAEQIRKVTN